MSFHNDDDKLLEKCKTIWTIVGDFGDLQNKELNLNTFSQAINLIRYKIIRSFIFGKIITKVC